tara:strand:+ start:5762 stop:7105 length:1344 start_codon:yes stop_codon:yes gene_type:complete
MPPREKPTANSFVLEKATISSSAFSDGAFIDIKNVITDIEIFEHLDKPYLTGTVVFVDDANIYNSVDFTGSEKLSISVALPGDESTSIEKDFIIQKVMKNIKGNDNSSTILVHIIEEHAFNSSLINVNKPYTGKPTDIIQSIIIDNLGKEFSEVDEDDQEPMRVIIPNLTPIEAALWVRNRAISATSTPYYLFSTLANKKLHCIPLDKMLQTSPDITPYWYSQSVTSAAASQSIEEQSYIIQYYETKNNDDILSMVNMGFVGAKYTYYDSMLGRPGPAIIFDIDKTLNEMVANDVIAKNQNKLSFTTGYELNGNTLNTIQSKNVTRLVSTDVFPDVNTYNEAANTAKHKQKVIAAAMRQFVGRNAIDVILPGRNFLIGEYSNTIGNQIKLKFLNNSVNTKNRDENLDTKKSGDYLMYAVKHVFKKERYDVTASCVKLADLPQESELS